MMKIIFNLLLSVALITLGFGLILSGLHAMPRVVSYQEVKFDTNATVPAMGPAVSPVVSPAVSPVVSPAVSPVVSPAVSPAATVRVTAAAPTVSATAIQTATAVPSGAADAQVVGYGTDKDTYNRGDTAKGYITLKNTGSTVINDITVSVSLARSVPALGTASLGSRDYKITGLNIRPGETKKAEFSVNIPKEYSGFSTAGDYDVNGNVLAGGKQVGSFSKHIKVT